MIGDAFYIGLLVWIVYVALQLRDEFERLQRVKRLTSEEGQSLPGPWPSSGARRVRRRVPDPKPQGRPER